jgi:serine acetyltransferase
VKIAPDCVIGAGAVIKADTQPGEVYATVPTQPSSKPSSEYDEL